MGTVPLMLFHACLPVLPAGLSRCGTPSFPFILANSRSSPTSFLPFAFSLDTPMDHTAGTPHSWGLGVVVVVVALWIDGSVVFWTRVWNLWISWVLRLGQDIAPTPTLALLLPDMDTPSSTPGIRRPSQLHLLYLMPIANPAATQ
ncbi:uncharacterized protein BDZ83DRAFT_645706 [Colletotrichum acutatum]|uniref:Secreted protein n=1 Tax=Glomerella acutata TaxID=27357 RepID=A0AAD8XQV6_GLOAC|nr:uncharacterized protein BDZ83DRAFT_645706 [Colletotrichum acutatum]KAK1731721.1 hypothetical protein BDZ83DRAFT_645706 [Colletotrichum acutatum]